MRKLLFFILLLAAFDAASAERFFIISGKVSSNEPYEDVDLFLAGMRRELPRIPNVLVRDMFGNSTIPDDQEIFWIRCRIELIEIATGNYVYFVMMSQLRESNILPRD